jgi:hypothetical protein
VSSAGGGLPGKTNGIDMREDAFQIALNGVSKVRRHTPAVTAHQRELDE